MFSKNQRSHYPRLSVIALELLGIGAMSAEVERVLSSAKLTVTDRRHAWKEMIGACECLWQWGVQSWIRDLSCLPTRPAVTKLHCSFTLWLPPSTLVARPA